MQLESNRAATFFAAHTAARRAPARAKQPAPPRWPHSATTHPSLTPDQLARAGYYYAPEAAAAGRGKGKARAAAGKAGTAGARGGSRTRQRRGTKASSSILSDSGDGLDTSDDASDDDHDGKTHQGADPEDDQCCCFTCGKKLGGWDETDDPYEEHWKRSSSALAAAAATAAEARAGEGKAGGKGRQQQKGGEIACAWATAVCSAVVHVRQWKQAAAASAEAVGDGAREMTATGTATGKSTSTGTRKRGKTTPPTAQAQPEPQSSSQTPRAHVYPRGEAHLHPRSELMTRAREQTYYPSAHQLQGEDIAAAAAVAAAKAGWWPHKVKRAWLCSVPNLAKAGFVYTPTSEEKDCVTCFYCGYSVSDWEPTDDPWKQHYDKSPNCPFFTETVEGEEEGEVGLAVGETADASDELAELPTTRSRVPVAGSKRPTSRSTLVGTKGRRTITTTAAAAAAGNTERSTARTTTAAQSRIPKTTRRGEEAPSLSAPTTTTTSGEVSDDEEKALSAAEPAAAIAKGRPKRGTTTTTATKVATRTTVSTTRKGTRGTTKSALALRVDSDDVGPGELTAEAEADDMGADELDALSRPTRTMTTATSQSRVKGSKTPATATGATATAEDSVRPSMMTTKKKPAATRKPTKRSAAQVKPAVAVSESQEHVVPVISETRSAVSSIATTDISDVDMASSHLVVTASEPSDTEKEDEFDDDDADEEEERRRERKEYLREEETVKSHRLQMVEVGAREAMAVMQNLGSKRLDTVRMLARDESATPRAAATVTKEAAGNLDGRDDDDDDDKQRVRSAIDHKGNEAGDGEVIELTAEEEQLTVVEYVRRMYARRREALHGAGEAKIRDWQERADQARRFIEGIPTRN